MPLRVSFEEHPFGLSWTVREAMTRTSHALVDDGRVWLVDPVDHPEALERVAGLGAAAGVLQLLDRHARDGSVIAARLEVPRLENPEAIPGSPFEALPVLRLPGWRETALWWPQRRVLVVAETIGTNAFWAAGSGVAGVHPMLRLLPPGRLRGLEPEHLLVGHGAGVHGPAATRGLEAAYHRSRRGLPALAAKLPAMFRSGRS